MVPDFMVELPSQTGGKARKLAELKVISCCSTLYSPGQRVKAVDRRANLLQGEYRRKAREADRLGGDHVLQEMGPVERKILLYGHLVGLVVGAFGEGSGDLHSLVQSLAESKVTAMRLRRGGQASEEELGMVVCHIRRSLSTTFVRAQAQCLLSRLNCTGQGFAQAFKQRNWAAAEDERMRKERLAQWIGRDRGRNLVRRGQFFLA